MELSTNVPEWTKTADHHFINSYKERWYGKQIDNQLYVTSADVDWEEMVLDKQVALEALSERPSNSGCALQGYHFNEEETDWIQKMLKQNMYNVTFTVYRD